jgi:hypothetical protein
MTSASPSRTSTRLTEFFIALGLEVEGRALVEGEFVDTVTGIPGSRSHIVMLRQPEGATCLERTAMAWSAASVSTRTSGAWRTCAPRGVIVSLAARVG